MVGHRCLPSVRMAKLAMGASLTNLHETESFKHAHSFAWFENGQRSHRALHHDRLCTDKFGFHHRFAILQEHLNDLSKILAQFLKRCGLGMCAAESGDVAHVELRFGASLNDCRVRSHADTLSCRRGRGYCSFSSHLLAPSVNPLRRRGSDVRSMAMFEPFVFHALETRSTLPLARFLSAAPPAENRGIGRRGFPKDVYA